MTRNELKNRISEYIRPGLPGSTTLAEVDKTVEGIMERVDEAVEIKEARELMSGPRSILESSCVRWPTTCGWGVGFGTCPPDCDGYVRSVDA